MGERRDLQKMKNSGNEAKEYLKTKDITFLKGANFARFACKLRPVWRQKKQKRRVLQEPTEDFRVLKPSCGSDN